MTPAETAAAAALNPCAEFYDGGWCASWGGRVMVYPQFKSELAAKREAVRRARIEARLAAEVHPKRSAA